MTHASPLRRFALPFALVATLVLATGCLDTGTNPILTFEEVQWAASLGINPADFTELSNGIWIRDDETGIGEEVEARDQVRVDYRGFLPTGARFDSSLDQAGREPLVFVVGSGQLIAGFDLGVRGMRPGGARTVLIPPFLGYGSRGQGQIPPNSWLVFQLFLVDVLN